MPTTTEARAPNMPVHASGGKLLIGTPAQVRLLAALTLLLVGAYIKPLYQLFQFAIHSDLFSHILLIPFISAYLIWINRAALPEPSRPSRGLALVPLAAGLGVLLWSLSRPHSGHDYLSWDALSLVLFFVAACFFSLGLPTLRVMAFPLWFLAFSVPFPGFVIQWIEGLLQGFSAIGADIFFTISGMTFLRQGLIFQIPGMHLEVAPECSGIHSSLVLLITSLVAAQLFLNKPINRAFLVFAVLPLGILRNAFRIWTIGELCVHIGPEMIDSPIHRRGGPLFFIISLIPFFLLLYFLRHREHKTKPVVEA